MLAGDGVVGIDLDGCRDPQTGVIADWAMKIIRGIRSYAEVTQRHRCEDPLPL